jgi:hypothetical protein
MLASAPVGVSKDNTGSALAVVTSSGAALSELFRGTARSRIRCERATRSDRPHVGTDRRDAKR